MASAFNLTAQINLRGPSNVRNIVSDIRRQLGTITGDVNLRINPATTRNVTTLNTALTALNNNLRTTSTNATDAANAIRQFGASVAAIANNTAGLNRNLNNAAAAANNAANNIGNTGRQANQAAGQMVEFGRTAGLAVRRFAAFSMSAGAIMGLTNAMRQGIDAFIDYDKQFVKLQQVTGESASGLSQLSNTITQLSTSLGVSSKDLTEVSLTLTQAGLTARDTERALKALALSSLAPSFDNMNQTVEGSIALMRQFGISATDLEKSLGAVNAVSAKFAVEASDIIAAIQRTGGVFASASKGVSEGTDALNEFIAVFTSVRATTRESAETIATGLRTIFTRIQRGGTIEALKEFGVNLTDAEGKFVGAYKAVQLLSEGLNQIDPRDLKFSEIVEELGGFRQIGKVIPLIQQFATAQDALRVAQQGQGSLTMDAAKAQASLANQAAKVREEFLSLFREIGGSDTFQALAKGALGLASALISVADSVKGVLPVLAIMMAFRGASGVRQFGSGFLRGFRANGAQGAKKGGFINKYARGGDVSNVPVALTPGEAVFYPEHAARIGTSTLRKMNHADKNGYRQKRARGGGIGIVPGRGNTDSFYTTLPVGSFVIRKKATEALGLNQRKKFATGGTVSDLGGSLIRSSVRETSFTYDKEAGEKFRTVGSEPTKFNTRDKYKYNKINRPINVDTLYSNIEKKTNPVYKEYMGLSTNARYGASKGIRGNSARNRGYAFEKVLQDRIKNLSLENKASNEFSRLDGTIGPNVFEAKSEKDAIVDQKLSEKMVSAALSNKSKSEKNMSDRLTSNKLNNKPNTIDLGSVILFQDTTRGLGQATETETKTKKVPKPKAKAFGGYVQKLMAGSFVKKGRGGRRANVRMNDWTLDEVSKIPSAQLPNQLGIDITEILKSAGSISGNTGMSANDIRTLLGPYSKSPDLKSKILSSLVVKANKIVEDRRNKDNEDTNNAISSDLLFGAIGMFGSSFPPTNIDIPGLDGSKKVRVFGQVLDKNNIEREARLAQMDKKDPNRASVEAAPTADQRAKQYSKAYLKTIGQGVQTSYVDEIIRLLDPRRSGLKAFFDFDKTLAFNTDPITEKQKEELKEKIKLSKSGISSTDNKTSKTSKTSKAGMYDEFYDKTSVARGLSNRVRKSLELEKTKPSALFRGLVGLSRQLKKKFSPADYNKFLSRLHIVTARPQSTVGSIASWVNSRGLNIPLSNFTGVGAKGTSAADIGLAKANVMAQALGQDKGVFVDDDPDNIAAASKLSGIKSFLYKKTKSSMGRATRKGIADTQGNAFEEEIRQIISKDPAAANIWTAMSKDSEKHSSIDFPYGIGSKIATNWFNNPLLARTPVDAKRTLTGPKGKIVSNIKNFIKSRSGYSEGDWVRGQYSPADIATRAKALGMTPQELTAKLEERLDNRWKDYAVPDWDISKKLGLLPSKKIYESQERQEKALEAKRQRIQSSVEGRGGSMGEYAGLTAEQKALREQGYRPRLKRYAKGGYTGLANAAPDSGRLVSLMYKKDKTQQEMEELDLIQKRRGAIEKAKIRGGGRAYGEIGLYGEPEAGEVTAAFTGKLYEKERFGTVKANKIGPKLFAVSFANATKGFAPRGLYDTLMESVAESGGRLTSDRGSVTPAAKGVWKRYFLTRKDVFKTPLPKQYWTASNLLDPRLKGPKSEWPPYHGGPGESAEEASLRADAWALQSSYFKAPDKIKQKSSVVRRASGGEIPIMAQEGEYVINRKSAKAIGYGNLNRLNKYHTGGKVQKFARGGDIRPNNDFFRGGVNYGPDPDPISLAEIKQKEKAIRRRRAQQAERQRAIRVRREQEVQSREAIVGIPSAPQRDMPISRQQLVDTEIRAAGATNIQALRDKASKSGKVLTEREASRRILQSREKEKIRTENAKTGVSMSEKEVKSQANKQVKEKIEARAKRDAIARVQTERAETSSRLFGDRGARKSIDRAEGTDQGKDAKNRRDIALKTLRAEQQQLKKFTSFSADDQLDRINKSRAIAGKKALSAAELQQRIEAKSTRITKDIAGAKTNYRNTIVDIAKEQIQSGTRERGGELVTREQRKNEAKDNRRPERTGFRGLLRRAGLTAQRAMLHQSLDAGTAAPTEFQRRTQDVLARAGTAGMAERSNTRMRDLTRSDAFRALDPAAKKQALADAGFGRNGVGSQAIMRGRNSGGGGGGNGGGGGSDGGGAGTGGNGGRETPSERRGRMMNGAMGLAFAIPMITDMISGGEPKTAEQARSNALTQGTSTTIGSSLMMGSMVGEMFGGAAGMVAGLGTAAFGVAKAMIDAENAAREFTIAAASTALESATEKASKSLSLFAADVKNAGLESRALKDILASTSAADALQSAKNTTKRGFMNFFDTGEGSAQRSEILDKKGTDAYLLTDPSYRFVRTEQRAKASAEAQSALYAGMIPAKSVEAAKGYSGVAELSTKFLEEKFKKGSTVTDMVGTKDFDKLTKSLALADSAVQEEIMSVQNSTKMTTEEKNARIANIIATQGETKAREIQNKILKEKALEELNRSTNHLQNSLERMFQNMEQAIGRNVFELNNLTQQAELSANALSGNAKAGQVSLKSINVLQNPRAYNKSERVAASQNAANMFGSESGMMKGLLQAGGTIEDTIMSTINKTIKEDPSAGNEKIGIRVQSSISQALERLQLPSDVSAKLAKAVNEGIGQIRQKGDEKIDFGDLVEKVPQLGKVMDHTRRAQEAALKALEHWQNGLNDYANSMNQTVDLQVEANSRIRRASDIQARSQMELDKVLGKEISLRDQMNVATAGVRSQTGGTIDPAVIAQNIRRLEDGRATQQSMSNTAGSRGFEGADEFRLMQDRLRNTNIALRENYDALKSMADNTEMASIAMSKINEIQQKRQAGVNMAERLVTSSPQELSQLNRAMDRLNNNMQGGINFGSSADQRKESLDAFNMIAPFLGEKQNGMKANVLESMLMESGVGVNPMMADVLQSLRSPESDPEMQAAIAEYKRAVDLQALANKELANLSQVIAKNTEETAATKLASVMSTFKFTFEGAQLNDVVNEIKQLRVVVEKNPAAMAPGKANGGIIYASAGQMVNFQPKGTDTVPAMLTPGEFVVNRSATQKHLPLLKNINSGNYSNGGKVSYYADGGYVPANPLWYSAKNPNDAASAAEGEYRSSRSKELESEFNYPILNKDAEKFSSLSGDARFWDAYYGLKGRFYATTSSATNQLISNNGKNPTDKNFQFLQSSISADPTLGIGYDQIALRGVEGNYEVKWPSSYESGSPIQSNNIFALLPDPQTFRSEFFDPQNEKTKKIKGYEKKQYQEKYKAMFDFLSNSKITKSGSELENSFGDKVSLQGPVSVPSLNPQPYFDAKNAEFGVRGLTAEDNSLYFLMNSDNLETLNRPPSNVGNIIGPTVTKAATGYGINARIASGKENLKMNVGSLFYATQSVVPYGDFLASYMKNYESHSQMIERSQSKIPEQIALQEETFNKVSLALENLQKDKFNKQTKQSSDVQTKISGLQNLWNNTTPYTTFDIAGSPNAGKYTNPLTLYNENISAQWDQYSALLTEQQKQKPFFFSQTPENFIEMMNLRDAKEPPKKFAWTDASFDDYNSVFGNIKDNIELVKKNVNTEIQEYNKNGFNFNYRRYLDPSRTFSTDSGGYTDSIINPKLALIEPQVPDISPFNPFSGGIIREGSVIWTTDLDKSLTDILSGKQTGFNTTQYVDPTLYPKVEPFTLSADHHPVVPYNFSKFLKARQENMEKVKNETALSYAKTDFNIGEYAKIDEAKKITLAREFYKLARLGDDVPPLVSSSIGKEITSVADIGNAAANIGSKIPTSLLSGNPEREKIDAWRAVFAEIYNLKDTNSTQTLQDLGVDLSDKSFEGYGKVEEQDEFGDMYTKYWDGMNVSQDLLQKIINRQVMSRLTQRTSSKFRQNEDDKLSGDSYTFGTKGAGKVESAEQALPDSWNRLIEVALDPQRIFPSREDRSQLIEKLQKFYTLGKNEYGEDLLPDDLKKEKNNRLEHIDSYFYGFDRLLNTGLKTGESDDKNAVIPWNNDNAGYRYKYFVDSLKAISSDEGKTNWNNRASLYQNDLNLETGRDTLHADQVEALIRASANLKEEQQKKNDQNQEGAGNVFSGVKNFATGGRVPVYAKNGTLVNYQPRGTDTVPAMLTPGEFVINRQATQKHLPVLKAINEGYYSRGGITKYLANGGIISPNYYADTTRPVASNNKMFDLSSYMGGIIGQISSSITLAFQNAVQAMSGQTAAASSNGVSSIDSDTLNKIGEFTNRLKSVADTLAGLSAIPQEITITVTHTHNVIINGDAALNKLSPDLQDIAMSVIQEKFAELAAANQIAGSPLINPFQV
jgi:TP901 family phage tail tape measure protein